MSQALKVGRKAEKGAYNVYEIAPKTKEKNGKPNYNAQSIDAFVDVNGDKIFTPGTDVALDFQYESIDSSGYEKARCVFTTPKKVNTKVRFIGSVTNYTDKNFLSELTKYFSSPGYMLDTSRIRVLFPKK